MRKWKGYVVDEQEKCREAFEGWYAKGDNPDVATLKDALFHVWQAAYSQLSEENERLRVNLESTIEAAEQCMSNTHNCEEVNIVAQWVVDCAKQALEANKEE